MLNGSSSPARGGNTDFSAFTGKCVGLYRRRLVSCPKNFPTPPARPAPAGGTHLESFSTTVTQPARPRAPLSRAAVPSRSRNGSRKAGTRRSERDTPSSLPPPPALKRRRNRVSPAAQPPEEPALTPRTAHDVKSPGLGPISIVFRPIHSSFSLTYLRHSVSAQACYCPDVVGLLCCTAPFIVPPALLRPLLEGSHLNRS